MLDLIEEHSEAVSRLSSDLKKAARLLGQSEARYLVDQYYQIQDYRIRSASQVRSQTGEPNDVLTWALDNMTTLERQIQRALGEFAKEYRVGQWLLSITGIGPVISAGLLAHLDVRRSETAGGFWRFAGLDPSATWTKGTKRPWNAELKVLLWKAGESFVKVQSNKNDYYGKVFSERKAFEWENNLRGRLRDEASRKLESTKIGKDTLAYRFYSGQLSTSTVRSFLDKSGVPQDLKATSVGDEQPMLPPAHIHARARRYAEKLFLSHVHHVMYMDFHGGMQPPVPYSFEKCDGNHRHFIEPPNWPSLELEGRPLTELLK